MERMWRSDLAAECGVETERDGVRVTRAEAGGCAILRVQIRSEEAAERLGKPCGRYVTVECGNIRALDEVEMDRVRCALAVEIREMAQRMCGGRACAPRRILRDRNDGFVIRLIDRSGVD